MSLSLPDSPKKRRGVAKEHSHFFEGRIYAVFWHFLCIISSLHLLSREWDACPMAVHHLSEIFLLVVQNCIACFTVDWSHWNWAGRTPNTKALLGSSVVFNYIQTRGRKKPNYFQFGLKSKTILSNSHRSSKMWDGKWFRVGGYISSSFLFLRSVCPICYCQNGKNSNRIFTSRSQFTPLNTDLCEGMQGI